MDTFELSEVATNKNKNRKARKISKVLHVGTVTGIAPDDEIHKIKQENMKINPSKNSVLLSVEDDDQEKTLKNRARTEAFLARLFASISAIKAAYSQLQFAQSPYDTDGIQSADEMIIFELKNLSELKQCFLKKKLLCDDEFSCPETTQIKAEIQEQKSLIKTYEVMKLKLDSDLKLKDSEIIFLEEKLEEAIKENKLLEKRLKNSSGLLLLSSKFENLQLSGLSIKHFITYHRQTIKSIRVFVQLLISEMKSAEWDLNAAAYAIEPDVDYSKPLDKCYTFESFICKEMFDGFSNNPEFTVSTVNHKNKNKRTTTLFFDSFIELKSVKPMDYLTLNPKSTFSRFCCSKYLRLIHSKMESSFFGNLDQRNLVNIGRFPETTFFITFSEMAKRVWLLHCLSFSFDQEVSIFRVKKRIRFSDVYMESVTNEPLGSTDTDHQVAFTVVPGFKIGKTVVQSQVYLC